jgi:YVTN family beta-propeller protein
MAKTLPLYYTLLMRLFVLVAALALMGCSKKEAPVSRGEPPAPAQGASGEPRGSGDDPVARPAATEERVYVSDEDSGNVVVISAASDSVIARIAVGKRPRGVRVSPDGTRLFVALSGLPKAGPGVDRDQLPPPDRSADGIGIVDLASLQLLRVIPAGQDPELFDVTSDGKRLWVSNEDAAEASLVDVDAGKVLRRVPVGKEPEGVGIHPAGKVVYVTNEADNSVSVLDIESGASLATVATGGRPRSVLFDREGRRAFVACELTQVLTLIDAHTHARTGDVALPGEMVRPMGLVISADERTLYVSGGRGKTVHVIGLEEAGPRVKSTITDVGTRPWGIGVTRSGAKLYTANGPSGDVSVIDTATGAVARRIPVGGSPWGIAVR